MAASGVRLQPQRDAAMNKGDARGTGEWVPVRIHHLRSSEAGGEDVRISRMGKELSQKTSGRRDGRGLWGISARILAGV